MMGVVVGGTDVMQILGTVLLLLLSDSDSDKKIVLNLKHTPRANFLHDDVY